MLLIIVLSLITLAHCDVKVWTFDTSIDNPYNWENGKVQDKCDGLVFGKYMRVPVFLKYLKVARLVLPHSGSITFEEGAMVLFDKNSKDDLNCVQLKQLTVPYSDNVAFWMNLNNPDNPAVPLAERPPCEYDDVVLPNGFNSSMIPSIDQIPVKSVTFGKDKLAQYELNDITDSEMGQDIFPSWASYEEGGRIMFDITGEECTDPTGCVRESRMATTWSVELEPSTELQCFEDIAIMGNFGKTICGAQIVIKILRTGFTLNRINIKLREYTSYTHASKYDPGNQIQIIFTEKNFTGLSVIEATEFYNILREDGSYFCDDITIQTSGQPLSEKYANLDNALSIVFGTLLGVIIMFGLFFFAYSPTVANLNLRNRVLSSRRFSRYILRYDNIEDRTNMIDAQSLAGSVQALNRAFENPMFDQMPSTSSTSNETVISSNLEDDGQPTSENIVDIDSAKELEEVHLHKDEVTGNEDVLLKDL